MTRWTEKKTRQVVVRVHRRGGRIPSTLRPLLRCQEFEFAGAPEAWDRRMARLRVRALLFANPDTPCSASEVASVLGVRESAVRDARPASARKLGRALVAPFAHWLRSLNRAGVLPAFTDLEGDAPGRPRRARGASRAPRLVPLGGPHRS